MSDWTARFRGIKGEPLVPEKVTKYWGGQKPYSGNAPFVDESFPPTIDSLLSNACCWDRGHQAEIANMGLWTHLRCSDFIGENFCVFDENVTQADIKQGQLGDCYFLAALAAMTEFPGLIEQNFKLGGKKSANGYYEILMFIDEEWQIVILDDYIPCLSGFNSPAFVQPTRKVIWMMLLEKAWAKVNSGWSNIIAGKSVWPFHLLTGFPCSIHYFANYDRETLWRMICHADSRNDIMTCSAHVEGNGIISSHQYTLRFAGEVKDDHGNTVRLLCIRNPWGTGEWQGDWSDNSPLWTPTLRKLLGVENRDDGVFYMNYNDFLNHYDVFEVAHSPNYYKNTSLFSHVDSVPKVYNLFVEEQTTLTVNVFAEESDFRCSVFLSKYDGEYNVLENKEASYLCCSSPFEGRIYNITSPGNYSVAVYPHDEKNFNVRFSSNGKHSVLPKYECDKNMTFLSHIKNVGICDVYFKKVQDTSAAKLMDSIQVHPCNIRTFCTPFNCNSAKADPCHEFKEFCPQNCTNTMICTNNSLASFKGEGNQSGGNHQNNFNVTDNNSTDVFEPQIDIALVFENNTVITRQQNCNYTYLNVEFPDKQINKVEIEVTMRDQGWCSTNCSGSWVEAQFVGQEGVKTFKLFENLAVPQYRTYTLEANSGHSLWQYMNKNYTMKIVARSQWAGWEMWIKHAKCVVN